MKLDVRLRDGLEHAARDAREAEELGFDGVFTNENRADAFLPLAVVAETTRTLELGTAVAIALARSPMTMAYQAIELQRHSGGRLVLGLGSQIRPHIERRFSMPWSEPAPRMREFVEALRAIWQAWDSGDRLAHDGTFYRHTLMTPNFVPPPNPFGPPKVYLAAVGDRMLRSCAAVADGLFVHPLCTERFVREVIVPTVRDARPDHLAPVEIGLSPFVAFDEREVALVRAQIAFYGSTPAYRRVLDLHGWGALQPELNRLSKAGRWTEMSGLISDDMVEEIGVVGTPGQVAAELHRRFGSLAQRVRFNLPGDLPPPSHYAALLAEMRSRAGTSPR